MQGNHEKLASLKNVRIMREAVGGASARKTREAEPRGLRKTLLCEVQDYAAETATPSFRFVWRYPAKPRPAKPTSIMAQVEGSGTPPVICDWKL